MKVLLFSDIHGDLGALKLLVTEEADLYISAGDLSTFGRGLKGSSEAPEQLASRSIWLSASRRTARCSTRSV
jgi:predicted phosphodiesterase